MFRRTFQIISNDSEPMMYIQIAFGNMRAPPLSFSFILSDKKTIKLKFFLIWLADIEAQFLSQ
tara:strand:+ start:18095 stop:18283 length:189 start_codon:yes stop_codon:yes gene_type:complete